MALAGVRSFRSAAAVWLKTSRFAMAHMDVMAFLHSAKLAIFLLRYRRFERSRLLRMLHHILTENSWTGITLKPVNA